MTNHQTPNNTSQPQSTFSCHSLWHNLRLFAALCTHARPARTWTAERVVGALHRLLLAHVAKKGRKRKGMCVQKLRTVKRKQKKKERKKTCNPTTKSHTKNTAFPNYTILIPSNSQSFFFSSLTTQPAQTAACTCCTFSSTRECPCSAGTRCTPPRC